MEGGADEPEVERVRGGAGSGMGTTFISGGGLVRADSFSLGRSPVEGLRVRERAARPVEGAGGGEVTTGA